MGKEVNFEMRQIFDNNAARIVNFVIKNDLKAITLFESYEDMKQELLMRIWLAMPNYEKTKGAFTTYAIAICKNEIRKRIRKQSTAKRKGIVVSIEEEVSEGIKISDFLTDEFNAEEKAIDKHYLSLIAKMLTVETYEYYIEGKTQIEIAKERNITQASVSRKIRRNIRQIQKNLSVGREL